VPNDPYLDASTRWKIRNGQTVQRELRYSEVVESLLDSGLVTEVLRAIGSGKEADVYLARDGGRLVAVKVYRTYRTSNKVGREMKLDQIGHLVSWEYDMLAYAWRDDAPVPRPYRREENAFSMQYLGTVDTPAPRLQDAKVTDYRGLADRVLEAVEALATAGVVHTDLSPYNILLEGTTPWIIDVGSCLRVDRLGAPPWLKLHHARTALDHGAATLARYFQKHDVRIDEADFVRRVMGPLDRYGILDGSEQERG
jgi:serine/threonine-protein kinase RIO1